MTLIERLRKLGRQLDWSDQKETVSDAIDRLEASEKLIEQLEKAVFSASETFSEYESIHLSEEPPDTCKAEFINWRGRQMSKALAAAKQFRGGEV